MQKSDLIAIISSQRENLLAIEKGIDRESLLQFDLDIPLALIISGVRRCGKSTLLHQLMERIKDFYYFNFEDPRLVEFTPNDFQLLDDTLLELYGDCSHYFLDEVQNVQGWEIFVRSRLDRGKHFVITGSNASLLSKELGTRLTGRHLRHELYPFSYAEMLQFKGEEPGVESFLEYLVQGGFPEYLRFQNLDILQQLFDDIVTRDVIVRYKLRSARQVISMATYLISNAGNEFSYTRLKNTFKLGSTNTAIDHVSYLEDAYLLLVVPRFDYSYQKQLVAPKKVYAIDTGLAAAVSTSFSSNRGRMLENVVLLQLKRKFKKILYFKEGFECDFLIKEKNAITKAIQVCHDFSTSTRKRELDGLVAALDKFKLDRGLIITLDAEDEIYVRGKIINALPAWKWMTSSGYP